MWPSPSFPQGFWGFGESLESGSSSSILHTNGIWALGPSGHICWVPGRCSWAVDFPFGVSDRISQAYVAMANNLTISVILSQQKCISPSGHLCMGRLHVIITHQVRLQRLYSRLFLGQPRLPRRKPSHLLRSGYEAPSYKGVGMGNAPDVWKERGSDMGSDESFCKTKSQRPWHTYELCWLVI